MPLWPKKLYNSKNICPFTTSKLSTSKTNDSKESISTSATNNPSKSWKAKINTSENSTLSSLKIIKKSNNGKENTATFSTSSKKRNIFSKLKPTLLKRSLMKQGPNSIVKKCLSIQCFSRTWKAYSKGPSKSTTTFLNNTTKKWPNLHPNNFPSIIWLRPIKSSTPIKCWRNNQNGRKNCNKKSMNWNMRNKSASIRSKNWKNSKK